MTADSDGDPHRPLRKTLRMHVPGGGIHHRPVAVDCVDDPEKCRSFVAQALTAAEPVIVDAVIDPPVSPAGARCCP